MSTVIHQSSWGRIFTTACCFLSFKSWTVWGKNWGPTKTANPSEAWQSQNWSVVGDGLNDPRVCRKNLHLNCGVSFFSGKFLKSSSLPLARYSKFFSPSDPGSFLEGVTLTKPGYISNFLSPTSSTWLFLLGLSTLGYLHIHKISKLMCIPLCLSNQTKENRKRNNQKSPLWVLLT